MEFLFQVISYDKATFIDNSLPNIPKRSAVYKITDTRGKLIVLEKTSNLYHRLERFFGPRSEMLRDLDLREITSRIEFRPTDSTFETLYLLYSERRSLFPATYRKMRTFRLFNLMKINRKQRFPRIYATRQLKAGVDYFGPFVTRGQFNKLKTTLERTFKLRPCLYNIRGNDPHPDCMYFQMHTCSRPCNNDIDRRGYLTDVGHAIDFIQGADSKIESEMTERMNELAAETNFEGAEILRRRLEKIHKARQEVKDTFWSVWHFNAVVLVPADSVSRFKLAFVREGRIVRFEEYDVDSAFEKIQTDAERVFTEPVPALSRAWQYDEFCLVSNFLVRPLQTVDVIMLESPAEITSRVLERLQQRKRRRKPSTVEITTPR
jgi:excinuclease UvrABC nuclease subunit